MMRKGEHPSASAERGPAPHLEVETLGSWARRRRLLATVGTLVSGLAWTGISALTPAAAPEGALVPVTSRIEFVEVSLGELSGPPEPAVPRPAAGAASASEAPEAPEVLPELTPETLPTLPMIAQGPARNPGEGGTVPSAPVVTGSGGGSGGGGGAGDAALEAPRFDVAYLNNPAPEYPTASRRLREEGKVLLRVLVSPEGRAVQVEIRQSSGYPRLDTAAREAVTQWRFLAARRGHEATAAWVVVPLHFSLDA